jgi:hypothetical protein
MHLPPPAIVVELVTHRISARAPDPVLLAVGGLAALVALIAPNIRLLSSLTMLPKSLTWILEFTKG